MFCWGVGGSSVVDDFNGESLFDVTKQQSSLRLSRAYSDVRTDGIYHSEYI